MDLAVITHPKHNSFLLDTFRSFNENDTLVDITFVCKGRYKIVAHKLVFASVSSLLRACFEDECKCHGMVTIMLPDIEPQILNLVLSFLYEGVTNLSNNELEEFKSVVGLLGIDLPNVIVNEVPKPGPIQDPVYNDGSQEAHVGGRAIVVEEDSGSCTRQKFVSLRNNDETDPLNDPLNIPDMYFAGLPSSMATAPVLQNKHPNQPPTTNTNQAAVKQPEQVPAMRRDSHVKPNVGGRPHALVKQEPKELEPPILERQVDLNGSTIASRENAARENAPRENAARENAARANAARANAARANAARANAARANAAEENRSTSSTQYQQPTTRKALPPRPRPTYTDPPSPTVVVGDQAPTKKRRVGRPKRKQVIQPLMDVS